MRIAVLSDIHANWHALEAVLDDCPPVDEVLCLGDVVGYGGEPKRCLDEVRSRKWPTLVGNHDRACTDPTILTWFNDDAARVIRWTAQELGPKRLKWLKELPEASVSHEVLLVHGSPRDPVYEYILDAMTAEANLELLEDGVCFHGHTHVAGVFAPGDGVPSHSYQRGQMQLKGPQLVNPGSVGQPRDRDPDASYGIWDVGASTFEFRRVPYDREAAKAAIRAAGLPPRFADRLDFGQ
jgi:diadenosine tetraphosphatase ApaH/serine/threonine PP2A family protein phosphatase